MRYLVDTHILLWWLEDSPLLPKNIKDILADQTNTVCFSIASAWEIEIKINLNKLTLKTSLDTVFSSLTFDRLDIKLNHILALEKLPQYHKDPFDRMLLAQAQVEQLTLITSDKKIWKYDSKILKVL